jgi:hypothetical protein
MSRLQAISPGDPDLPRVVDLALKSINVLEGSLRIQDRTQVDSEDLGSDLRSGQISGDTSLVLWGKVIVTLWRVAMGFDIKPSSWDGLTLRLLIWRCIAGDKGGTEEEWARQEVVRNLRSRNDE